MGDCKTGVRDQIIQSLTGTKVIIRDLNAQLEGWPHDISPHLDRLREDVDHHLNKWFDPGKRREKIRGDDPGLFGAMWWPYGSYEALQTGIYLSIFMFAWDDETDSNEYSSISENLERSQRMRDDTIGWVRRCLGLEHNDACAPTNKLIRNFESVARPLQQKYDIFQRKRLCEYIELYINDSGAEQHVQHSERLPNLDEYRRLRIGTSAVYVFLGLTELCYDMRLPNVIVHDPDMMRLQLAANLIISFGNDVLSVRKEVASGQVDSLVPLLYHERGDAQQAMDAAIEEIQGAVEQFDGAAATLRQKYAQHVSGADVERMIKGCQHACTSNVVWSLSSKRYGLGLKSLEGGVPIVI